MTGTTEPAPQAPPAIRDHLAIALDVDDIVEARRLAKDVAPWFGVAKVGLELFAATGPTPWPSSSDSATRSSSISSCTTSPRPWARRHAWRAPSASSYLTIHAVGGAPMLRAGVEGLLEGASRAGLPEPVALAVTILTSDDGAPPHILGKRVQAALEGGCGGLVCAASDLRDAKELAPDW